MRYLNPSIQLQFNQQVWDIVRRVPSGKVITYGQVASVAGVPPGVGADEYRAWGARWVGSAMAACPDDVPWQRVVNSQGKISLRESGGGDTQRQRLEAEGIEFDANGRIDLRRFGWKAGADS
jgi:methylated-DNA-protein-cysteine methyltransferase-like protein